MITSDIQELFDGVLGDEQAAELFHALSVSPERRADFGRHVALQGAMQADRFDNRLTSDEDMAIWGTIAGLGVAGTTTVGSSAAAWAPRIVMFVLAGVVGYILGTTSFGDIFSGGSSNTATRGAADKRLAPFVVVPIPAAQPSAPAASPAAPTPIPAAASRTPNLFTSADDGTRSNRADGNAHNLHNSDGRPTTTDGTNRPIDRTNGAQQDGSNAVNNSTKPNTPAETSPEANGTNSANAPTSNSPTVKADAKNANDAAASAPPMGIDPQQLLANSSNGNAVPMASDEPISALSNNGFEVGYGHSVGFLRLSMAGTGGAYSNPHLNISYRMLDGAIGVGGRLGLGNLQMLGPQLMTAESRDASSNGVIAPVRSENRYTLGANAKQLALLEAFANYRLVLGTRLALNMEGSFGGSFGNHMQAGGNLSLVYFVSDRIGIQGGLGINRYWYNVNMGSILGTEDASIDDNAVSRSSGTIFSANYGAFFHF